MTLRPIAFGSFVLDPANRQLRRDGAPVELNARYFDALALLAANPAQLISKDRFLDEVWRGVPVTDEALTQCIKTLRRTLGDDAANPRFIETVPKHGYRFVGPVDAGVAVKARAAPPGDWRSTLALAGAGTIGGGMAGLLGGLVYGIAGVSREAQSGGSELSVLLVMICLSILAGLIGGAGVSCGIALGAREGGARRWRVVLGGAFGGLVVGAAARLLGLDAFSLLFGRAPSDITGALEAALVGAAAGAAIVASWRHGWSVRRGVGYPAAFGAMAGLLIVLSGGTLMAGSLDQLATEFAASRLTMDRIASLLGEPAFGPLTNLVTTTAEAALFTLGVTNAIMLARRSLGKS